MRVADISAFSQMPQLRHLAIRWNTKIQRLDSLVGLELRSLILEETPRLQQLAPIARLRALRFFEFSGGMNKPNVAESLWPLAELPRLSHLNLLNLKVKLDGLIPLAQCGRLKVLEISNQFPTDEYAFLSVRLPKTKCAMFGPWERHKHWKQDIMIVGKGKPFLSSKTDQDRIRRYEHAFTRLRSNFAANKRLQPIARKTRSG